MALLHCPIRSYISFMMQVSDDDSQLRATPKAIYFVFRMVLRMRYAIIVPCTAPSFFFVQEQLSHNIIFSLLLVHVAINVSLTFTCTIDYLVDYWVSLIVGS